MSHEQRRYQWRRAREEMDSHSLGGGEEEMTGQVSVGEHGGSADGSGGHDGEVNEGQQGQEGKKKAI